MTSRVTDLDRAIAKNIRRLRDEAKLTQPQVAGHLGITYQSYQKMEGGKVAFRASTLDQLAQLYNMRLHHIIGGADQPLDPVVIKALLLLHGMDSDARDTCVRAILAVKHGKKTA